MKKQITVSLLLCASAFVLAGCVSPRAYTRVSSTFPQIPVGDGRVFFFWGNDFIGGGAWEVVELNGDIAGYLSQDSFFYRDKAPGSYIVFEHPKGLFAKAIGGDQLIFKLDAGETKYIRLKQKLTGMGFILGGIATGGHPIPVLEDRDSAMKVLPKCLYYQGKYHVF